MKTSWGKVAKWYENVISDDDSYQNTVIKPNLLRLLNLKKGEKVLDVACGSGFFTREFVKVGAEATGLDIGRELVLIAKQKDSQSKYLVGNAEKMESITSAYFDAAVIVLALQNIKNYQNAISEIARVLKPGGRLLVVLNHPAFRIPKKSFWGYDEEAKIQYRKLDGYMSEFSKAMDMHPGKKISTSLKTTFSYHRPLQVYFKAFNKAGLVVTNLEEWISNKKSDSGPRANAENVARIEFPLFMAIMLKKSI